jgi:hypothetical protein
MMSLLAIFGRKPVRQIPGLMDAIDRNKPLKTKLDEFQSLSRQFFQGISSQLCSILYPSEPFIAGKWRALFEHMPMPKLPFLGPIQTELGIYFF